MGGELPRYFDSEIKAGVVWAPAKNTGFEILHELADEQPKSVAGPMTGTVPLPTIEPPAVRPQGHI